MLRYYALQAEGIEPGKRYWLKSGSRRQRVSVQPASHLDLKTGKWDKAERLPMNGIGKVHLVFDEQAIFDTYGENRTTGAFILIDPDTLNTVAGGMITGRTSDIGGIHKDDERVILSLPADLADKLMATELFANRRHDVDVRHTSAGRAAEVLSDLDR